MDLQVGDQVKITRVRIALFAIGIRVGDEGMVVAIVRPTQRALVRFSGHSPHVVDIADLALV